MLKLPCKAAVAVIFKRSYFRLVLRSYAVSVAPASRSNCTRAIHTILVREHCEAITRNNVLSYHCSDPPRKILRKSIDFVSFDRYVVPPATNLAASRQTRRIERRQVHGTPRSSTSGKSACRLWRHEESQGAGDFGRVTIDSFQPKSETLGGTSRHRSKIKFNLIPTHFGTWPSGRRCDGWLRLHDSLAGARLVVDRHQSRSSASSSSSS
jgi:hypothetical protein